MQASAPAPSRMALAGVRRGVIERPLRVVLYGVDGVGKSSFGARAPDPIFLCGEDGVSHLDVARFPEPSDWGDVIEALRVLASDRHEYKTIVIDSLDWLEPLNWADVCREHKKQNMEGFSYGKGIAFAIDRWRLFTKMLDALVRLKGMHVILLAHAQVKKQDDLIAGAFDRYRMKMNEKSAEVIREWADAVLFAKYEVFAVEKQGRMKGISSGARVMFTQWTASYDAKNRFDLPETLPLGWDDLIGAVRAHGPAAAGRITGEIEALLPDLSGETVTKVREQLTARAGDAAGLAKVLDWAKAKLMTTTEAKNV